MSKKHDSENTSVLVPLKYSSLTHMTVSLYKGAIILYLPGAEPLWMTASDADNLAASLRATAKTRRAIDRENKREK